jgi:serine/threonine-protein kinase
MNRGPLPLDLALDTAMQMAEALAFAHEHGVIHRDIKPANVVLTGKHGRVKLTDFGIAHLVNSDHTQIGQMLGSPRYMSPEQAMGREVDGRSDIFSLGAVLYEMLTGHYAFDGDSLPTIVYRVIHESPEPAASLCHQLPDGLPGLLDRMLDKNPSVRPDARTLIKALQNLAQAPATSRVPEPPPNRIPRLLRVLAFGTPLAVFLLIGVGIIIIEYFLPAPPRDARVPAPPPVTVPVPDADKAGDLPPAADPQPVRPQTKRPTGSSDAYLAALGEKEVELRVKRTELLLKYTTEHPDVAQIDRQLDQLRSERRRHVRQLQKSRED